STSGRDDALLYGRVLLVPRLLDVIHGAREGLLPVLRLPVPLHVLDAHAGPCGQLPPDVPRLGSGGPLLLSPHRILVRAPRRRGGGEEGLRREPDRRLGIPPRDLPHLRHLRQRGLRYGLPPAAAAARGGKRARERDRAPPL